MNRLSGTSTFKDFQDLLVNEDDMLKRQILYLNSDEFERTETDLGYLQRNFHFFMAIVLQGVSVGNDKIQNIKYLHILYPDENKTTYENPSTWRRNAGNFINGKGNIDKRVNDGLRNISEDEPISSFIDGTWYDFKNSEGNPIFYSVDGNGNKKSIFTGGTDESGNTITGEDRAKRKMRQIAEFFVNGKQIISTGEFNIMTDPVQLLKANMQLIMNGAPGTGKTFFARNSIADDLLGIKSKTDQEKEEIKKIQFDMVQFHPSYDYTDFIEGIRPVMVTNDNVAAGVSYTLKNGAFKRLCRRAGVIERLWAAKENINEQSIDRFLKGEDKVIIDFWKKWFVDNGRCESLNAKINQKPENNDFDDAAKSDSVLKSINLPPFLFIIDEINRAEISKVLGETMYCLDADYRGSKGMIATQYSSMATEESFFVSKENDKFFIPSNVYIIGTMNDIDRSVEVFDFALRRRFAWFEVKAEDVMDSVLEAMEVNTKLGKDYEDYKERIDKLNKAIKDDLKLNCHYHLGPSYFAKINLYLSSVYAAARRKVWNNHLSQILYEYVKGKKTEDKIEEIGREFCD